MGSNNNQRVLIIVLFIMMAATIILISIGIVVGLSGPDYKADSDTIENGVEITKIYWLNEGDFLEVEYNITGTWGVDLTISMDETVIREDIDSLGGSIRLDIDKKGKYTVSFKVNTDDYIYGMGQPAFNLTYEIRTPRTGTGIFNIFTLLGVIALAITLFLGWNVYGSYGSDKKE